MVDIGDRGVPSALALQGSRDGVSGCLCLAHQGPCTAEHFAQTCSVPAYLLPQWDRAAPH